MRVLHYIVNWECLQEDECKRRVYSLYVFFRSDTSLYITVRICWCELADGKR